jgi:ABC-type phosphate transport system substrate-binding protein
MLRPGLLLLGVALLPASLPGQEVGYRVVVHTSNSVKQLTRDQVSRIVLRKVTLWDNRQPVLPVDQAAESPVRRTFTKQVHNRTIASVQTWSQQQTFAGVGVAPPERASDSEVLDYIRKYPNAIGYVRIGFPVGADIKTLDVRP